MGNEEINIHETLTTGPGRHKCHSVFAVREDVFESVQQCVALINNCRWDLYCCCKDYNDPWKVLAYRGHLEQGPYYLVIVLLYLHLDRCPSSVSYLRMIEALLSKTSLTT